MIKISESTNVNENVYTYEVIKENKVIYSEDISFKSILRVNEEKVYLLIYTPDYKPISEAFNFLNYEKEKHSLNSKIKSMQCLKLLFTFERIIHKKFQDFSSIDVNNLKYFIRGMSPKGNKYEFHLKTIRRNDTINSYLAVYRQFAIFLNVDIPVLMRKSSNRIQIPYPESEINYTVDKFRTNERVPRKMIEVPWYISVEDFEKIINEIRKNFTVIEEVIVRLMFQCGLRIGEVLGLTGEDLVVEKIDNIYIPIGYIRNRLSDKNDQYAKTCMNVFSKKEYETQEYKTLNYGYQKFVIPFDLYNLINSYIEEKHLEAREKAPGKYFSSVIADKTTNQHEGENYYVFLNSQYNRLSSQLWNIRLRKIFGSVGIIVDQNKREHNLNHRFRHGFAMFHVQHLNLKSLELMERMRHTNVTSVLKYYKPTITDAIKIKMDFVDNLYKLIPSLNKGD